MDETVRSAVFGNVGTMVTFRVSPDDSPFLIKYFEPQFEAADLSNFNNRLFVSSMSINGEKDVAFSGMTLNIPPPPKNNIDAIIAISRKNYAADKASVEHAIRIATEPMASTTAPQSGNTGLKKAPNGRIAAPLPIPRPEMPTTAANQQLVTHETESQKRRKRRKRAQEAALSAQSSVPQHHVPAQATPVHPTPAAKPKASDEDATILKIR